MMLHLRWCLLMRRTDFVSSITLRPRLRWMPRLRWKVCRDCGSSTHRVNSAYPRNPSDLENVLTETMTPPVSLPVPVPAGTGTRRLTMPLPVLVTALVAVPLPLPLTMTVAVAAYWTICGPVAVMASYQPLVLWIMWSALALSLAVAVAPGADLGSCCLTPASDLLGAAVDHRFCFRRDPG